MRPINLTKHHGLGNDFLIAVDPARTIGPADAVRWCDRRTGVGADGLIMATQVLDGGEAPVGRWRMTLFNADGSRAEISGNGIRCLGQAIADHQGFDRTADHHLLIETDAGARTLVIKAALTGAPDFPVADGSALDMPPAGADGPGPMSAEVMVRVGMGKAVDGPAPSSRWAEAGVAIDGQRGVDVGNPHIVGFVSGLGQTSPDGATVDMAAIGPIIEADYPGGVNVHLVSVTDRANLDLLVWERGAGVTNACGSGACAAAWAAHGAGLTGDRVTVNMPGGTALVELTSDEVFLTGPAVRVATVIIDG